MEPLIFLHVCALGHWKDVLKSIITSLKESGLLKVKGSKLFVGLLASKGDRPVFFSLMEGLPYTLKTSENLKAYEHFTLEWLRQTIKGYKTNHPVLYLHTKAITRDPTTKERLFHVWRNYLVHWLVTRWEDCLEVMEKEGPNVLSVYYRPGPKPHFAGNFWWSTVNYLKTLPSTHLVKETLKPRFKYIAPEVWILWSTSLNKVFTLHQPSRPIRCFGIGQSYRSLPIEPVKVSTL